MSCFKIRNRKSPESQIDESINGFSIDDFVNQGTLGQGNSGSVYQVYHKHNENKKYALKVISKSRDHSKIMFKNEIQMLQKIQKIKNNHNLQQYVYTFFFSFFYICLSVLF